MSRAHSSVIELNGKLYDLKANPVTTPVVQPVAHKPKPLPASSGTVMDGFMRRPRTKAHTPAVTAPKKTQRSKTLMRSAVKKPVASAAAPTTTQLVKPVTVSPSRLARASRINKSSLISRFGAAQEAAFAPKIVPLPVKSEPAHEIEPPILTHHQPAVAANQHNHGYAIERALHHADSHKQPKHRKAPLSHRTAHKLHLSPRAVKATGAALAILVVTGFVVYQNVPRLAMKVAATRAGISANLPDYQPAGFALNGSIQYSPGQIAVSYKSNSDDRTFTIIQKAAQETVPSNVLGATTTSQIVEQEGKTIYIDEENRATWVEQGILYEIDGKDLSSDQLLRLTSSL